MIGIDITHFLFSIYKLESNALTGHKNMGRALVTDVLPRWGITAFKSTVVINCPVEAEMLAKENMICIIDP